MNEFLLLAVVMLYIAVAGNQKRASVSHVC
jgi:hypothetical protein